MEEKAGKMSIPEQPIKAKYEISHAEQDLEAQLIAKVRAVSGRLFRHDPRSSLSIKSPPKEPHTPQYGGMRPKRKLMAKETKYFDSADWAMQLARSKAGGGGEEGVAKGDGAGTVSNLQRVSGESDRFTSKQP